MGATRGAVLAVVLTAMPGACCTRSPQPDVPVPQVAAPAIARLVPDHARIADGEIVVVRIIGSGFAAEGNVIEFGPVVLTDIRASAGGDTLTFTVPLEVQSGGGAPPRRIDAGVYDVVVRTGEVRSAPARFRVTDADGAARP